MKHDEYEWVRNYYGVPAKTGAHVKRFIGGMTRHGKIVGASGPYVRVLWFDKTKSELWHPRELTWEGAE